MGDSGISCRGLRSRLKNYADVQYVPGCFSDIQQITDVYVLALKNNMGPTFR